MILRVFARQNRYHGPHRAHIASRQIGCVQCKRIPLRESAAQRKASSALRCGYELHGRQVDVCVATTLSVPKRSVVTDLPRQKVQIDYQLSFTCPPPQF